MSCARGLEADKLPKIHIIATAVGFDLIFASITAALFAARERASRADGILPEFHPTRTGCMP
jgi:hypothetical protein